MACGGTGGAPCPSRTEGSFLHRFGSSLNPHFHFHLVVADGLFEAIEGDTDEKPAHRETRLRFREATALTHELPEDLQHTVRKRVLRHFRRHGLLEPQETEDMLAWDYGGGFSLDASVRIEATDRRGLERLIRYCARPPLPWTASTWSAAALTRFSSSSRGPTSPAAPPSSAETPPPQPPDIAPPRPSRWASLLARIYEAFPLICPTCQTPLTFISALTDPEPITQTLAHLGEPTSLPLLHPAPARPQPRPEFPNHLSPPETHPTCRC